MVGAVCVGLLACLGCWHLVGLAVRWGRRLRGEKTLTLGMPSATAARFDALKRLAEARSDADVVARAVAVYDALLRSSAAGLTLVLESPDGGRHPVTVL